MQHGGQPVPDKLRDQDLRVIRSRFIAYPVLGLMWASAQEQRWDTLSECDGWVNIPLAGVEKGTSILRVALPSPCVQTSVPCGQSYANMVRPYAKGAVLVDYGCAQCRYMGKLLDCEPLHTILFDIDSSTLSDAARMLLRAHYRLHVSLVPLSFVGISAAQQVCKSSCHAALALLITFPLTFPLFSSRTSLRAQVALVAPPGTKHVAITFRPGSIVPPPGHCESDLFVAGHGNPPPIGYPYDGYEILKDEKVKVAHLRTRHGYEVLHDDEVEIAHLASPRPTPTTPAAATYSRTRSPQEGTPNPQPRKRHDTDKSSQLQLMF